MKKNVLLATACSSLMLAGYAQNVGINTDASLPNSNAILDIKSSKKGVLIPRLNSIERNAIPNTKGLLVYEITTDRFWYNNGKEWICISTDHDDKDRQGDAWLLKGNDHSKDGVNFLGTTNNVPLNIRVNNQPSGRIDSARANTFWGYRAGVLDTTKTTGTDNTATGFYSLANKCAGSLNSAYGSQCMYSNLSGYFNSAIGASAMYSNSGGYLNSAIGVATMYFTNNGFKNTATGAYAMFSNVDGTNNTVTGESAMNQSRYTSFNTVDGDSAMYAAEGGDYNTAIGASSMFFTQGSYNTAIGTNALRTANGYFNTAAGFSALFQCQGGGNSAIGIASMYNTRLAYENTAIGDSSLFSNTTGNHNTGIGSKADVSRGDLNNATAIGNGATVDASNKVRIGNTEVTVIEGQVPFTNPSDGRFKFNIQEDVKGLAFILKLRPVTYQFDVKKLEDFTKGVIKAGDLSSYVTQVGKDEATQLIRTGFIAQEVEQAAKKAKYEFDGVKTPKTEREYYSLSYSSFVVPLVKAVQEQQQIIQTQTKQLEEQQQMNDAQNKRIDSLEKQLDELKQFLQSSKSLSSSK